MSKQNEAHIVYVITKLELGGAQKICLTLLKGVNKNEVSTSLISGMDGVLVPLAKKTGSPGSGSPGSGSSLFLMKRLRREVGIKNSFSECIAFFQMISRMRALKKRYPAIIVHTHSTKAGLMGRWAAFFARIKPIVHTVHGFGFHDYQSKPTWILHFILEYLTSFITTHYVCVSQNDRRIGGKFLPRFYKKSSIIRAAVDWNKFYNPTTQTDSKNPKKKFIFGTVSCLKPQKNILDLLKAFQNMYKQLNQTDRDRVHLQIIGDGVQREKIEKWLKKNKLENRVDLLGWQENVNIWMKSWDVFVMSSLWEGLPCAIIEARLSKLPVISYKIAGIPEVIKNFKTDSSGTGSPGNGFLIKPGNWQELGQKMKLLLKDPILHKQMSLYQEILTDFSDQTMIENHTKLYKKILNLQ